MLFVNYSSARVTYLLQTRNIRIFMISRICTIPFVWNVLVEISFYDFTRGVAENISLLEQQQARWQVGWTRNIDVLFLLINIFGPPPKLFYFCFVVLVHWRGWGGCQRGGGAGQGHVPRPQPHVAEQRGHLWPRGPRLPRPLRGGHLQGLDHSDVWRYRQQTSKRNPGYNIELPTITIFKNGS